MGKIILFLITGFFVAGCATGHCRARKTQKQETVFVYKADGSRQCGMGTIIPIETMAEELKGIKVYSQAKKSDGFMHAMVCGGPTGQVNAYEILKSDLNKAISFGFKELKK